MTDLVIVVALELQPCPDDAFFECQGLVGNEAGNKLFQLFFLLT